MGGTAPSWCASVAAVLVGAMMLYRSSFLPVSAFVLLLASACGPSVETTDAGTKKTTAPNGEGADAANPGNEAKGGDAGLGGAGAGSENANGTPQSLKGTWLCEAAPTTCVPPATTEIDVGSGFENGASDLVAISEARHFAIDRLLVEGEDQILAARFVYGVASLGISGETVDAYVSANCSGAWDFVASGKTMAPGDTGSTSEVEHQASLALVYVPDGAALPVGRHAVHFVVRGDGTSATGIVEIVPKGTQILVTDMDGTLTDSETAAFSGGDPGLQEGAKETLIQFVESGYPVVYLTARPFWYTQQTRDYVADKALPAGIVHVMQSALPGLGQSAIDFKLGYLTALKARGLQTKIAIGNTATDAESFHDAEVASAWMYRFDDAEFKTPRFNDYAALPALADIENRCE